MKISEVIEILERFAPPTSAEEWDRVGLMIGDPDRDCSTVSVALDLTSEALEDAIREGAELIVTHHPFIWDALERIDTRDARGKMIAALIKNGICVYSMHTNLDMAQNGLNATLAKALGGKNIRLDEEGCGAVFDTETTLGALAKRTANVLGDDSVLVVGDSGAHISRAYVVTGSGGSAFLRAMTLADVLITGELKHNQYIEAVERGFKLIEFSHYYSEIIAQDVLREALADTGLKIIKAAQSCPFRRLENL